MRDVEAIRADLAASLNQSAGHLVDWFAHGVAAVEPRRLVRQHLLAHRSAGATSVLAVGKAAVAMAWGADDVLDVRRGLVIADEATPVPDWADVHVGGHPLPTAASMAAADAALEFVASESGPVLALISGGGSALMERPHPDVDLADVQDVMDQLIRSGAPIGTINGIRARLSSVKAGGLAAAASGVIETLVLSDVADAHPGRVASGPTVPDDSRTAARDALDHFAISGPAADRIRSFLQATPNVSRSETGSATVIGSGRTAGRAIVDRIVEHGGDATVLTHSLDGPADEAALIAIQNTPPGTVGILTGETTVAVSGSGIGGRNQHAALRASLHLAGTSTRFLAAGTDGIDGPTTAAGAVVDGSLEVDRDEAEHALAGCNSHPYLASLGALITTGRTGTNVGDVWLVDKLD